MAAKLSPATPVLHRRSELSRVVPGSCLVKETSAAVIARPPWWQVAVVMGLGCALAASVFATWLSQRSLAGVFVSAATWERMAPWLSGNASAKPGDVLPVEYHRVLAAVLVVALSAWCGGALVLARSGHHAWSSAVRWWGVRGWTWWCVLGAWEWLWVAAVTSRLTTVADLLVGGIPLWFAACLAGWLTTFLHVYQDEKLAAAEAPSQAAILPRRLMLLALAYTAVFVTLNWRLWFNLYIPHGDSAMYEEHLWNLLHGKGFRSYLDQGLFLGEHVQVVHLGLLPLYVLWPSHLLLELCESVAIAAGVFPVAWMTCRQTGSPRAALAAAAAYVLYFPTQFLDIEIDLKTFRPEAFGIPLLLFTLDQLDRGSWKGFLAGVLACLTVKEDYSLVFLPLGIWVAATARYAPRRLHSTGTSRAWLRLGVCLAIGSVLYLWLATRVVMPWFRAGEEIHYARYFSRLGETPEAIVRTVLTQPDIVAGELLTTTTALYALALLVPVGGVSLFSPGRLAVGLPLFGVLCLNELARSPQHHFHAPLVPIVFWAAAGGLPQVPRVWTWLRRRPADAPRLARLAAHGLWSSALSSGVLFSLSPLGLAFWDPGSNWNAWKLYGPTGRGVEFAKVAAKIPRSARVASTDFVHPRFTHHERSYDYSGYARRVSGYERRVPDDTDFIVIDCTHPYSQYRRPEDVPEYHQTDRWELVPDDTNGYYIVLKRRR
uniref:DUF2079 domain-containing protein n=1 Tax=Schlesneria paludicola TaxID=360056 RepID=A0A7C4LP09_9PLAN